MNNTSTKPKKVQDLVESTNKYDKVILKSYYSITRNIPPIELEKISDNDENFFNELLKEYLSYLRGEEIQVVDNQDTTLVIPEQCDRNKRNTNFSRLVFDIKTKKTEDSMEEVISS